MSDIAISAFFAPTQDTPEHIRLAEELGFARAWCYDSPLLYDDVFVTLARAAERTSRIGLGVGVLVPGLRSPVVTANAVTSIAALAPGRVVVAVGAGFTGRFTLGLPPVRLARLETEVADLRALLGGGEAVHAEGGAAVRLIRVPGADGPWDVPIYVSCRGPRAQALARTSGDGAMTGVFYPGGLALVRDGVGNDIPLVVHAVGAVRDEDEPWDSPRLVSAVGPVIAVAFHQFAEQPWRLEGLEPELRATAEAYLERIAREVDAARRHQDLHRGHLVEVVLEADRELVTPGHIRRFSVTGTGPELVERARQMATDGVTELAIQPGGDVPDELRRLAAAFRAGGLLRSPDGS
jgi:5,10-methylenetetrahydromethanopterin reductase